MTIRPNIREVLFMRRWLIFKDVIARHTYSFQKDKSSFLPLEEPHFLKDLMQNT